MTNSLNFIARIDSAIRRLVELGLRADDKDAREVLVRGTKARKRRSIVGSDRRQPQSLVHKLPRRAQAAGAIGATLDRSSRKVVKADADPRTRLWDAKSDGDPLEFVISMNMQPGCAARGKFRTL
jgi:hypothetical protein